ncbi:hypothetical protein V8F06_014339 [Rhypophila decipiens]
MTTSKTERFQGRFKLFLEKIFVYHGSIVPQLGGNPIFIGYDLIKYFVYGIYKQPSIRVVTNDAVGDAVGVAIGVNATIFWRDAKWIQ